MNLPADIHSRDEAVRFLRYCTVGVLNTMICLGVIFLCKSIFEFNPYLSNALGYTAGLINSFLWNKKWVFRSEGGFAAEALRFILGFALCYALQFVFVWQLNQSPFGAREFGLWIFTLSGYGIATILGNVLYTVANFLYNRLVTFR